MPVFVVVDSLFIVPPPIVCGVLVKRPCFMMYFLLFFLVCNHLTEKWRAGCFYLIVSMMLSRGCMYNVFLPWSAVC